jgi:murein DD-endopeptidase MepM/ murein hydrolase activator NlpD
MQNIISISKANFCKIPDMTRSYRVALHYLLIFSICILANNPAIHLAKASSSPCQQLSVLDGDSWWTILKQMGDPTVYQTLWPIIKKQKQIKLRPGMNIQYCLQQEQLQKIRLPQSTKVTWIISQKNNQWSWQQETKPITAKTKVQKQSFIIEHSIYKDGQSSGIPSLVLVQTEKILSQSPDKTTVHPGDQLHIIWTERKVMDQPNTYRLLDFTLNHKEKEIRSTRFTDTDGITRYYQPNGVEGRASFDRFPITSQIRITSKFSTKRSHPILKTIRPHHGVDLAAVKGTPIYATGDGVIAYIGQVRGYGRVIKIQHKNAKTVYAHMDAFNKELSVGQRIRRQQVIGYVGSTGLATGPHCHYEFHRDGQPMNPETVDLPRAHRLPKAELVRFQKTLETLNVFSQSMSL